MEITGYFEFQIPARKIMLIRVHKKSLLDVINDVALRISPFFLYGTLNTLERKMAHARGTTLIDPRSPLTDVTPIKENRVPRTTPALLPARSN